MALNTSSPIKKLSYYDKGSNLPEECLKYSELYPGTIGCHFNHYYAIYHAWLNGYKQVAIFEDDVTLNPLANLDKCLSELPSDWDCLNFGWIESIVRNERKQIPISYSESLYYKTGMHLSGAFGYLLSRSGMAKALTLLSDIRYTTDLIFKDLHCYYSKVPLALHPPASAPSRIRAIPE